MVRQVLHPSQNIPLWVGRGRRAGWTLTKEEEECAEPTWCDVGLGPPERGAAVTLGSASAPDVSHQSNCTAEPRWNVRQLDKLLFAHVPVSLSPFWPVSFTWTVWGTSSYDVSLHGPQRMCPTISGHQF